MDIDGIYIPADQLAFLGLLVLGLIAWLALIVVLSFRGDQRHQRMEDALHDLRFRGGEESRRIAQAGLGIADEPAEPSRLAVVWHWSPKAWRCTWGRWPSTENAVLRFWAIGPMEIRWSLKR